VTWLAVGAWLLAAGAGAWALVLRHRLELTARAEHELRGPLAALALAVQQVRRGRSGPELAAVFEAQLDRSRRGVADLAAARHGRLATPLRTRVALDRLAEHAAAGWAPVAARAGRSLRLDWRAGAVAVLADQGRIAQALGNLLSNALEHGGGAVELRSRRDRDVVRIEVTDAGRRSAHDAVGGLSGTSPASLWRPVARGRGLAIARQAVEEAGGSLEVDSGPAGTRAILELPLERR
jgi:signal transduction histidine kinase